MDISLKKSEMDALSAIFESDLHDLASLVRSIGYKPETFFEGQRCTGLDFRGTDISMISFKNSDLNGATFLNTQVDQVFSSHPKSADHCIILNDPLLPKSDERAFGDVKNFLARAEMEKKDVIDFSTLDKFASDYAFREYFSESRDYIKRIVLDGCNVSDLYPIQDLVSLRELSLVGANITNMPSLYSVNTKILRIRNIGAVSISALAEIPQLRKVDLSENRLRGFKNIRGLRELTHLEVESNDLGSLFSLRWLKNLEYLKANNNRIKSLQHLKGLTKLKVLDVSGNKLADLSPLQDLRKLQNLNISKSDVDNISPLAYLPKLARLNISKTRVSDLGPLISCKFSLRALYLHDSFVEDLRPLSYVESLERLYLGGSPHKWDLSPLTSRVEVNFV